MSELIKTLNETAAIITTAEFFRNKGASVEWYIISMASTVEDQEELRVRLYELGFLTNANSRLTSLQWRIVPI
jgi:hypothetical protein